MIKGAGMNERIRERIELLVARLVFGYWNAGQLENALVEYCESLQRPVPAETPKSDDNGRDENGRDYVAPLKTCGATVIKRSSTRSTLSPRERLSP